MVLSRSRQCNGHTQSNNVAGDDYDFATAVTHANIDDDADADNVAANNDTTADTPDAVGSLPVSNADGAVTIPSLNTQPMANVDKAAATFHFKDIKDIIAESEACQSTEDAILKSPADADDMLILAVMFKRKEEELEYQRQKVEHATLQERTAKQAARTLRSAKSALKSPHLMNGPIKSKPSSKKSPALTVSIPAEIGQSNLSVGSGMTVDSSGSSKDPPGKSGKQSSKMIPSSSGCHRSSRSSTSTRSSNQSLPNIPTRVYVTSDITTIKFEDRTHQTNPTTFLPGDSAMWRYGNDILK